MFSTEGNLDHFLVLDWTTHHLQPPVSRNIGCRVDPGKNQVSIRFQVIDFDQVKRNDKIDLAVLTGDRIESPLIFLWKVTKALPGRLAKLPANCFLPRFYVNTVK